jgi:hypothetical protein
MSAGTATHPVELPSQIDSAAPRQVLDGRWASVRADVRRQWEQRRLHRSRTGPPAGGHGVSALLVPIRDSGGVACPA